MSDNNISKKTINALIWAGVMLATAFILRDKGAEHGGSLLTLFILGWFVSDNINNGKWSLKEEVACIRGIFNKN
jgi:hypothetical protein